MRIAVIVVTWNSSGLITGVLEALARQTRPPEKVFIIDNGSADAAVLAEIVKPHTHCELVLLDQNRGFAAANNVGITRCQDADYIALLNPDAFPAPDWLAELISAAAAHPECGSFASRLVNYNNPLYLDGAGDYLSYTGKPGRRGHGKVAAGKFGHPEPVIAACAAAALYSRDALFSCGGFDEDFFCYIEDVDLGLRMQLRGWSCWYVPSAVAYHVGSAVTGRRSDFSVYYGHRNIVWTFVKNMPGVLFWVLLPAHIAMNLLSIMLLALRGQGRVALRSKWDAIRDLPKTWRKRQQNQVQRTISVLDIWKLVDKRLILD
jgi:GT2 family glycosyltransferase